MTALRVLPPHEYVGAVEAIPEISRGDRRGCSPTGTPTASTTTSTSRCRRHAGFGRESNYDRDDHARPCSASAAATPSGPASATRSTRCCGGAAGRRAVLGHAARPGPAGLAHRVQRHRAQPPGHGLRRPGRRLGPDLPAPRALGRPRRGADRHRPVRRALRARRDDRAGRREDEQVARQPRAGLQAAGRRRRPDGRSGWPCSTATTAPTASGRAAGCPPPRRGCGAGARPSRWPPRPSADTAARRGPRAAGRRPRHQRGASRAVDRWVDAALGDTAGTPTGDPDAPGLVHRTARRVCSAWRL